MTPARHPKQDAGIVRSPAPVVEIPARPLGLAGAADFDWRKRAGQPAFRDARRAEDKEDWPTVVTACKKALAADPTHLEAAWLLAAALGATGKLDDVLPPLAPAAAGDFGKWGPASLELPALRAFLATPAGAAWRRRVDTDRATYAATLARAIVVVASGDLYAVDGDRWLRLTRTSGNVVGALALEHELVYVTRARIKKQTHFGIGTIDLARGHTTKPVDVATVGPLAVAGSKAGIYVASERAVQAWTIDDGKLHALPRPARPPGPWLEIVGRTARLHQTPVDVTADFDEHALASSIRIDTSNRVVSVPSPGQIDGSTVVWAPDKSSLALVASLDEHCTTKNAAAVFVVEAATGKLREIARDPDGMSVDWLAARKLALASSKGVAIYDLDTNASTALAGATDLVSPRRFPRCTPVETDESTPETTDEPDDVVKP